MRLLVFFVHPFQVGEAVGGAHRRFLEISRGLSRAGHVLSVIERQPSLGSWLSAPYVSVPVRTSTKGLRRLINHLMLALRVVRAAGADIVYVPVPMRLVENLIPAFLVARLAGKPLVLVFHHFAPENECSYGTLWKRKRAEGLSLSKTLRSVLEEMLVRLIYRNADLSIAVSESTAREVSRLFGMRRIIVNGNGVDFNVFKPSTSEESRAYDTAFLGRLHPDKGIDTIFHAWQIVLSKVPTAKLVLIGGNRPVDVKRYSGYLEDPRLAGNITLTGYLEDSQVADYLARSEMFVYPSVREGFGMAVAEAMACGLPCIVSDIPALRENFQDTAIFVPPRHPEALATAIEELLTHDAKRREMGNRSRAFAARFDWETICQREEKILTVLQEHSLTRRDPQLSRPGQPSIRPFHDSKPARLDCRSFTGKQIG